MLSINELRVLAEDLHSANGPNRYASALSRAADEISQWRSVFGHLGTPDEVGNEWHALLDRLNEAKAEGLEQAHLLGISAERELMLLAKLEAVEKERDALLEALKWMVLRTEEGGYPDGKCLEEARAAIARATGKKP